MNNVYLVYGVHEENTLLRVFKDIGDAEEYASKKPISEDDYDGFEYYDYLIEMHKLY